jgi:hypothetical protein
MRSSGSGSRGKREEKAGTLEGWKAERGRIEGWKGKDGRLEGPLLF